MEPYLYILKKGLKYFSFILSWIGAGTSVAWAACDQTLTSASNVVAAITSAKAGTTICLNAGTYGTLALTNITKTSDVTIQSTSGKSAIVGFSLWASTHLKFQNLTISELTVQDASQNISALSSTFTGQVLLTSTAATPVNILIDGSTFDGISACTNCYEGRIQVMNSGLGVVISNNHFGGGGESDGVQIGASGVVVGPGNVFEGLLQGNYSRHIDSIQGVGPANLTITGNYFFNDTIYVGMYDGGSNLNVTNNVFGPSATNEQKLQLGAIQGLNFLHNTVQGNYVVAQGAKTGDPRNTNAVYKDNIFDGTEIDDTGDQPGCASGCVYQNNMFSTGGQARGTNNLIGLPTFTGGVNPNSWTGFLLIASSLGHLAATDGKDLGASTFSTATSGTSALRAPTNLRILTH